MSTELSICRCWCSFYDPFLRCFSLTSFHWLIRPRHLTPKEKNNALAYSILTTQLCYLGIHENNKLNYNLIWLLTISGTPLILLLIQWLCHTSFLSSKSQNLTLVPILFIAGYILLPHLHYVESTKSDLKTYFITLMLPSFLSWHSS